MEQSQCLHVSPISSPQVVLVKSPAFDISHDDRGSTILASKGVICRSFVCSIGSISQTPHDVEPDSTLHMKVSAGFGISSSSHLETVR